MKYIASCSFGKDSLAMILKILDKGLPLHEVIFYNTGMEFDCIYNIRDKLINVLHEKKVLYTELSPNRHFLYDMLIKPVKYRNPSDKEYPYHYGYDWCGAGVRWGTNCKTTAIQKYLKTTYQDEDIYEYIGIAYDEPARIKSDDHKLYPLVEWKLTEKDCLDYCHEKGYYWMENGIELYSILDRVSCWCCQNKNLKELRNIYIFLPEYWQRLRGLQSRIDIPMKGVGKSVFDLEERFKQEIVAGKST